MRLRPRLAVVLLACALAPFAALDADSTGISGSAPGFVEPAAQSFRLLETSDAVDAGGSLDPDVLPDHGPVSQYREHQALEPRPADAASDLGAFELPEPGLVVSLVPGLVTLFALYRLVRRAPRSR